ncbi:MAG: alpha/beta hydrolase family protein [Pirellulales bacterium]
MLNQKKHLCILSLLLFAILVSTATAGDRQKITFKSTADGSEQQAYLILPDGYDVTKKVPLVVSLHSWSADLEQRNEPLEKLVDQQGWIYLFPNFRGVNRTPAGCGSLLAQQDIIDAVAWAKKKHAVDDKRVYLTGNSGGGHMTMLMSAKYPNTWTAASAWVGISDLAAWYQKHQGSKYGNMMESALGGAPGASQEIDKQYRDRSPLTFLHQAKDVALDISAGVNDGYVGSVPITHSLLAFNKIAQANGSPLVSETEIAQISGKKRRLKKPQASDQVTDASFGREIHLRRTSGQARITIFEGAHEGIATAAIAWFKKHDGK